MSDIVGAIDEMRGFSEEGVDAGGNNDGLDFALLARGAGVHLIAGILCHGQGLAGES